MLLDTENRAITTHGVTQVARATIKTSPKIFNFFADQTYANKPKAITRELCANAVDSHVMAGKPDLPVEVWLPTMFDPTFRVRDFGLGMSHEFMMTSFMCYADGSTKDSSNEAIGGFGIGSKSPFAYVDQYTVVSRFDGTESVYSIFKDEDGIPAIGLLGQRDTDQPNGVEVAFPVKPEDFGTFEEAAFEALRYFEPLPVIKNATDGSFNPPEYATRGDSWAMRPQTGPLGVIMGGIRYPVDASNLGYKFPYDSAARKLLNYGLDLRLPIGSCSIALSREQLSYDDRTVEALREACEKVVDEVAASFAEMFDHLDSEWEARVALHKEVSGAGSYTDRGKFLVEHAKWKGEPFSTRMEYPRLLPADDGTPNKIHGYHVWNIPGASDRRSRRRGNVKPIGSAKWETSHKDFVPGAVECLIIDDLPQSPKHKVVKKIKELLETTGESAIVIRPWEEKDVTVAQILTGFGNPPADQVVFTSSLPEPVMERKPRGQSANRPKVRMFTFDGSNQRSRWGLHEQASNLNPGHYGRTGVTEIPYANQPSSGILVVMEKFDLPRGFMEKMKYELIRWDELYFVNAGDAKKLEKSNWQDWAAVWEQRKKQALAAHPNLPVQLALDRDTNLYRLFKLFRSNPNLPDLSVRTPIGKAQRLFRDYVKPLSPEQRQLAPLVELKMPACIKPATIAEDFRTKQPKANRLLDLLPVHLNEEDMKLFLENLK